MKNSMRIGRVHIHRPPRENSTSFVCSLAMMMTDVMDDVLKRNGVDNLFSLNLKYDRELEEESFYEPLELADPIMDVAKALGIDTDHLIH